MSNDSTTASIEHLFGVADMSPEERDEFFASVGDVILNATFLRFMTELPEREHAALEQYLESVDDPETAFRHVIEHYPLFGTILEEEATALREDAVAILGDH